MSYDPRALEQGIEKCKQNIVVFEEAIKKEYETISEYRKMINVLDEKEKQKKQMEESIEVVKE